MTIHILDVVTAELTDAATAARARLQVRTTEVAARRDAGGLSSTAAGTLLDALVKQQGDARSMCDRWLAREPGVTERDVIDRLSQVAPRRTVAQIPGMPAEWESAFRGEDAQ